MSPTAYALYQLLRREPPEAKLPMEALTRTLRSSKTAVRRAFEELRLEGLIDFTREV